MIEDIFRELKTSGLVSSGNQFSRDWLGMEESYLRCLRTKGRQPSAKVLARCARRLKETGDALHGSTMHQVVSKAATCQLLADLCVQQLLERS